MSDGERATTGRPVGRPPILTVERVVDAAIGLVDEKGLVGLSMPKLAARLEVGTMTLYGYVAGKEELLQLMAARIFEGLVMPTHEDPHHQLTRYFRRFREAALAHPALAQLLAGGRLTIPAVFDTLEEAFETMVRAGHDAEAAVRTFYAALAYTLGFVLWEIPRARLQPEGEYRQQWAELTARLDPTAYPVLTGPAAQVTPTTASTEQFEWGLARILPPARSARHGDR